MIKVTCVQFIIIACIYTSLLHPAHILHQAVQEKTENREEQLSLLRDGTKYIAAIDHFLTIHFFDLRNAKSAQDTLVNTKKQLQGIVEQAKKMIMQKNNVAAISTIIADYKKLLEVIQSIFNKIEPAFFTNILTSPAYNMQHHASERNVHIMRTSRNSGRRHSLPHHHVTIQDRVNKLPVHPEESGEKRRDDGREAGVVSHEAMLDDETMQGIKRNLASLEATCHSWLEKLPACKNTYKHEIVTIDALGNQINELLNEATTISKESLSQKTVQVLLSKREDIRGKFREIDQTLFNTMKIVTPHISSLHMQLSQSRLAKGASLRSLSKASSHDTVSSGQRSSLSMTTQLHPHGCMSAPASTRASSPYDGEYDLVGPGQESSQVSIVSNDAPDASVQKIKGKSWHQPKLSTVPSHYSDENDDDAKKKRGAKPTIDVPDIGDIQQHEQELDLKNFRICLFNGLCEYLIQQNKIDVQGKEVLFKRLQSRTDTTFIDFVEELARAMYIREQNDNNRCTPSKNIIRLVEAVGAIPRSREIVLQVNDADIATLSAAIQDDETILVNAAKSIREKRNVLPSICAKLWKRLGKNEIFATVTIAAIVTGIVLGVVFAYKKYA